VAEASSSSSPIELTVILPVHDGAATIDRQLRALVAQEWDRPWEILVVDNDSADGTPEIVGDYVLEHERVRAVAAKEKLGLSYARNVGVANTDAPAVVFCDDDDVVGEGFVAAMGRALQTHPIVACRFEYERLNDASSMAGHSRYQSTGLEEVVGYPVAVGPSGWQTDLWRKLDGNDESMTIAGEDFDMVIRANLEYGVVPHFESAAIYHKAQRVGFGSSFRQARRDARAHVLLYKEYARTRVDKRVAGRRAARQWASLLKHVGDLRADPAKNAWAWRAGKLVGRLEQSVRSGVFLP
jgi:glycosyltransferase involved in cell wall biosynthesis